MGRRSGPKPEPVDGKPRVQGAGPVVQRVKDGDATLVLKYVRCCKKNCRTCVKGAERWDSERPGHGPYWYREIEIAGKTQRRYIGRSLVKGDKVKALQADIAAAIAGPVGSAPAAPVAGEGDGCPL